MKEWESQNLIFLLRLKLRAQAIKGLISVWCVQGPGNSHPRFLPWAESREVKSSAQQAGVGLTACPAWRMELLTACPPRRMGLLAACPLRRMGLTACPPVEDGAGHGVSPHGGSGSRRIPQRRMGLVMACPPAEDGAGPKWALRKGALGQCNSRGQGHPGRQLICRFLHSRTKQRLWPRRGSDLHRASALQSSSVLRRFQFTLAGP